MYIIRWLLLLVLRVNQLIVMTQSCSSTTSNSGTPSLADTGSVTVTLRLRLSHGPEDSDPASA